MRVVFIGTVHLSYKSLEKLIEMGVDIVGVCTKKSSLINADFTDLTPLCTDNNIPYKYIDDINNSDSISWIEDKNPDIIFCFGWSHLLKENLLRLPPMGVVGYHPTALPKNRGRHPLIWSLVLGLDKSASSFFFMDEGADSGDILSQVPFDILHEDTATTLSHKVENIALSQIEKFVPKLQDGTYTRQKQDHSLANSWRKRSKKDGLIDFRLSSEAIYNLVRALTKPYVGAHIEYKGKDIIVWSVQIVECDETNIESGKVIGSEGNMFVVKSYDGAIKVVSHEFESIPKVGEYL
jgi:methionyl-tRNA formyltransferase